MTSMAGCVGGLGIGGDYAEREGRKGGGRRAWVGVGAEKPHAGAHEPMGPWVHEGHGRRGRVREG